MMFQSQNGEHCLLTSVYLILRLRSNIMSLGKLDKHGCKAVIEGGYLFVYDSSRSLLARVRRSRNRLYILNLKTTHPVCLMAKLAKDDWLWHARYSHLNFQALRNMTQRGMVIGMPIVDHVMQVCDLYVIAKHHCTPFPHSSSFRVEKPL